MRFFRAEKFLPRFFRLREITKNPRRHGQPCSFIMYSAADYVEMLII
jgi:hypothetical protein